jgi:hypothetical protein
MLPGVVGARCGSPPRHDLRDADAGAGPARHRPHRVDGGTERRAPASGTTMTSPHCSTEEAARTPRTPRIPAIVESVRRGTAAPVAPGSSHRPTRGELSVGGQRRRGTHPMGQLSPLGTARGQPDVHDTGGSVPVGTARRAARRRFGDTVDELHLPRPFDVTELCRTVGRRRGRPSPLLPITTREQCLCGVCGKDTKGLLAPRSGSSCGRRSTGPARCTRPRPHRGGPASDQPGAHPRSSWPEITKPSTEDLDGGTACRLRPGIVPAGLPWADVAGGRMSRSACGRQADRVPRRLRVLS